MDRALTPQELGRLWKARTGKPLRYMEYQDLIRRKTLPKGNFVLFYPLASRGGDVNGHYTAVIQHPDATYFYDSYGGKPDAVKKYSKQRGGLYAEGYNTLIGDLLRQKQMGKVIDYNDHRHQSLSNKIATCGRHCLNRLAFANLSNDQYDKVMKRFLSKNPVNGQKSLDNLVMDLWS